MYLMEKTRSSTAISWLICDRMMKTWTCYAGAALLLLLSGCEFQTYKEYRTPPYDGAFTWTRVTREAGWSNRLDHTSVSFNNRIWVMGGFNPGVVKGDPYLEDVWSSADGVNWRQETASAPWLGRRGHASVVFDDGSGEAIYVIGGFVVNEETGYREYRNDVWKSPDGIQWIQIKERTYPEHPELDSIYDWFPRFNHACVVANHGGTDYIYLIGGATMLEEHSARYSMIYFNDVWRSTDGIHWDSLPNTDYGRRSEHAVTVDPASGVIFLQGGRHGTIFEGVESGSHPLPDWHWLKSSDDGINWYTIKDTAALEEDYLWRAEHHLVIRNSTLFSLPGKSSSNQHFHFARSRDYTIWRMDYPYLFSVDSEGSDFDARYGYSLVEHENKIWILGGDTNSGGPDNDVWYGEL